MAVTGSAAFSRAVCAGFLGVCRGLEVSEQQFQSSVMDELRMEMEADAEYNAWLDRINEEMREVANESLRQIDGSTYAVAKARDKEIRA